MASNIELPSAPHWQYMRVRIRPDVDLQRDQVALLILPPPVTSIHPQAEINYLGAEEAKLLWRLRRKLQEPGPPIILTRTVESGQAPPVYPLPGCRTCRHGDGISSTRRCTKRERQPVEAWDYCEMHEEEKT